MTQAEPPEGCMISRGLNIPLDPMLKRNGVRRPLRLGLYEKREVDAIERVVRPHDRVLELGTGIGFVSAYLCTQKKVQTVHTYEANPNLLPYIRRLHEANGVTQAVLHHGLVTPEGGPDLPFHVRQNVLASSLDGSVEQDQIIETVHVPQRPVAEVIAEVQPTVLICDIEGAEAQLLPAGDWSGLRLANIEIHSQWIGSAGVRAVFDAMQAAGLTYFPHGSAGKVVTFKREF